MEDNNNNFRSTNKLFSAYNKSPYSVPNENDEEIEIPSEIEEQSKEYKDYLGPNLFVFGAQRSGKTHAIKQLILNNVIKGKQIFYLCGEKWSSKEQQHFERQLDLIGKSLVLIHVTDKKQFKYWMLKFDNFTSDLHNSKVLANEQREQDYSLALVIDDLQDIVETKDSGIVSALQAWRHRNVTIVCLNQTFSQNIRHRSIYSHCSHFLFFRLSYANSMFSFLNQVPSLLRVTSRGVNGHITIKPRVAIQQIYYDACCATNKTFGHLLLDLSSNKIHHTLLLRTNILNVNEQRSYSINADGLTFTYYDTIREEGLGKEHHFRLLDKREHIKKETYKQGEKIKENGGSNVASKSTGRDTGKSNDRESGADSAKRRSTPYQRESRRHSADSRHDGGNGGFRQRVVRRVRRRRRRRNSSISSSEDGESTSKEHDSNFTNNGGGCKNKESSKRSFYSEVSSSSESTDT